MTFAHFWSILLKRWRLIVICFMLVGLGTFIGSKLQTHVYQSSVIVEVALRSSNNQSSDYTNLLASDQLVQTESQLAVSNPVLREVASHYQGLTAEQLSKNVTSSVKLNTQLFEIDVLDPSPTRAAILANDVAATLIKQRLELTQQDNNRSQQQIQQDLDSTQHQIDTIIAQIATLKADPNKQPQVASLQTQVAGLQQHYSQWQTLLAQLEFTEAQNGDFLRVAQPAQPGTSPVRPQVLLNTAFGLVAGLLLGMVLAVLFEQLDTRVRTSEALADLLGWPMLGTVWSIPSSKHKKENVINPGGNSANVESYRILRANIGFSSLDKPLRSLVVVSALPNDGKSTIAANLAIFMAKAGKNTLLVDADLRHSAVHEEFGLHADKMGLTNAVLAFSFSMQDALKIHSNNYAHTLQPTGTLPTSNPSLKPFIHPVEIPNLWVMPAGPLPPNPSELLDSKAMERLTQVLANCGAEIVIFDSPPLLGLSDTSILASKMDGTIVVTDITRAKKGNLKQMKAILEQSGANVLGFVVNKQRYSRKDSAYSYYYYDHTEDQRSEGRHSMKNGNVPDVPTVPTLPITSGQQRMNSTDN
jgi:capsular exopolysaccharide synthesis family protein